MVLPPENETVAIERTPQEMDVVRTQSLASMTEARTFEAVAEIARCKRDADERVRLGSC